MSHIAVLRIFKEKWNGSFRAVDCASELWRENRIRDGNCRLCTGELVGQSLDVQLEKLKGCDKVFKEKRSGVDTGRPALKQCLEFLRDGDTLLVTKIDRLARSTSDPRRA